LDAFLAARRVGPTGRVIGVDFTLEMVKRANETAEKSRITNVEFRHAQIERLPLDDGSVDVAISNCVMNHCADKVRAFKEVYRVLKVGGRMCHSDLVASCPFSKAALADEVWGEWLAVAQSKRDYLRAIEQAGFQEVNIEEEAGSVRRSDRGNPRLGAAARTREHGRSPSNRSYAAQFCRSPQARLFGVGHLPTKGYSCQRHED
jgi:SAM-dependent methyltransferase